ncbi:prophage tail fiber family protein [Escherichia coli PA40]|nr:prophage tail fiber family protein [Escherichia coli PA40]
MAVKISGVLKDGTGKPVENCTNSTESQTDQQHGGGEHGGL